MRRQSGDRAGPAARPEAGAPDGPTALFNPLAMALLEEGPPILVADAAGRRLYANGAYERIASALADSAADPQSQPSWPFHQPSQETSETAAAVSPVGSVGEACAITFNGRVEYYRVCQKAMVGAEGADPAVATIYAPVSSGTDTGDALAVAIERLEDVTRLVSDWVWETDRDLVITFVSPRVSGALGFHQVEIVGRRLTQLPAQPEAAIEILTTPAGRRPFRDISVEIPDRQGEPRHFLLSGLPVYSPADGRFLGFRGTANDVTEARWHEEALLRAKETAELANRTKGEFLANMSHELRTPLNAIIGFSEVMMKEILGPLGNDQYKSYCSDITDSARHLLVLINDILDAAKIDSGQMTLSLEPVEPYPLIQSVSRLMEPRAERGGVILTVHDTPSLPRIRADKTKLRQILINLVSNAVKFTLQGGRVDLSARVDEGGVFIFEVSDTGIGIAAKDIPRALAPFGQVDSRISRRFEGTGLGLPLAKSLTELHDGTFELTSQPDKGTRVTIRLPGELILHD